MRNRELERKRWWPGAAWGVAWLLALACPALAPCPAHAEAPSLVVPRVDGGPKLDGRLDDPIWTSAARLGPLIQVEPVEGGTPSERTEVLILYDARHLYLGVRCFDREPDKIIAKEMIRDGNLTNDDRIALVFDTYHDRRNAFFFQINPNGARRDALIENNRVFIDEWDGIWMAKSRIDEQGWVTEIRIPFSSLSFDPDGHVWGFNILRSVRRRNETNRWSSARLNLGFIDVSEIGTLEGLHGLEAGRGIDFRPQTAVTYERDRPDDERSVHVDPGFDLFYRITPSLKGVLTVNPDFSDAPVDDRQVNLSRFNLFFPETRDFFLEDSGIFEFANLEDNGRPFFSRRLGLGADGTPVPIRVGARVTGRIGPVSLGLLDVQQGASGATENKNLAIARARVDVLERSSAGILLTRGDPVSNGDNAVAGIDFRYRNDHMLGDQVLTWDAWTLRSFSSGISQQQWAAGTRLAWPNDRWNGSLELREFGENFRPGLGFVNRVDVRDYRAALRFRHRPSGWLRTVDTGFHFNIVTDLDSRIESADLRFDWLDVQNEPSDQLRFRMHLRRERLDAPFEISRDVFVPIGTHNFWRHEVFLSTGEARRFRAEVRAQWGSFYTGDRLTFEVVLELRPTKHLFLGLEAENNRVRLPEGHFDVRLARARLDLTFTPDLSWTTIVQYDNVSHTMGINSRIRWIIEPEREIVFIVNQGFTHGDGRAFHSTLTETTAKVQWSFRF